MVFKNDLLYRYIRNKIRYHQKMHYVLTASHIDSQSRFNSLIMTIQSIEESFEESKTNYIHYISVSGSFSDKLMQVTTLVKERLDTIQSHTKVFTHDKRLTQFQHLEYIVTNHLKDVTDDDVILFIDDDDLLLNLPCMTNYNVCKGVLFIPESTCSYDQNHTMNRQDIIKIRDATKHKLDDLYNQFCAEGEVEGDGVSSDPELGLWSIYYDFSGYMARAKIVKEYFRTTPRQFGTGLLEDVQFMEYLDNHPGVLKYPYPFVFYHIDTSANTIQKEWKDDVITELGRLTSEISDLKKLMV